MSFLSAFGLLWESSFPLPVDTPEGPGPRVELSVQALPVHEPAPGTAPVWTASLGDGHRVQADELPAGGYVLSHGAGARFAVDGQASRVRIDPGAADEATWMRFMLDTVLWWSALMHGRTLLHAGVVERDGVLTAVLGPSGAGKSTLLAGLIGRGARLFSDDLLCLDATGLAHPGPGLMNVPAVAPNPERLGRELARFPDGDEDERWIAAHDVATRAGRPDVLLLLDRRPDASLRAERVPLTPVDLLPHVWALPGRPPDPMLLFEVLSGVADGARAYHVEAGPGDAPDAVARLADEVSRARD